MTVSDLSGDLDANRPVPFRLTPNIAEFLTMTGVTGPLTASMVASARCLVQPQYKLPSFLRAILRDEYITWHKKVGVRVFLHASTKQYVLCLYASINFKLGRKLLIANFSFSSLFSLHLCLPQKEEERFSTFHIPSRCTKRLNSIKLYRKMQIYILQFKYFFVGQKQEEMKPGVEPTDMDSEQLITMVNKAVSAITTRLHSKSNTVQQVTQCTVRHILYGQSQILQ